jgi:hypothetical protein
MQKLTLFIFLLDCINLFLSNKMGNNIKSRLHKKKQDERPGRGDNSSSAAQHSTPSQTKIDEAIMSGPNRARAADEHAPAAPQQDAAKPPRAAIAANRSDTGSAPPANPRQAAAATPRNTEAEAPAASNPSRARP